MANTGPLPPTSMATTSITFLKASSDAGRGQACCIICCPRGATPWPAARLIMKNWSAPTIIRRADSQHFAVMAGLDPPAGPKPLRRGEGPAIHVFDSAERKQDVD